MVRKRTIKILKHYSMIVRVIIRMQRILVVGKESILFRSAVISPSVRGTVNGPVKNNGAVSRTAYLYIERGFGKSRKRQPVVLFFSGRRSAYFISPSIQNSQSNNASYRKHQNGR